MRIWRWIHLVFACFLALPLASQHSRRFDPESDVSVGYQKGAVLVEAPAGTHLKAAFMGVKLKEGTKGRLKAGPMPATNGQDELGDGIWRGPVAVPVKGEGLVGEVELVVTYQPCTEGNGGLCYPPTEQILKIKASEIPTLAKREENQANASRMEPPKPEVARVSTPVPGPVSSNPVSSNPVSSNPASPAEPLAPRPAVKAIPPPRPGFLWTFLGIFAAGLLASLTPCVYPMIPITMAIIGAKGGGRTKGFLLSAVLVLGMAVTYTALGVVAARTGSAFGAFTQRPAFLIPVSVVFASFAISLFGAFEIRLPGALQSKLQGSGPRHGFLGHSSWASCWAPFQLPA